MARKMITWVDRLSPKQQRKAFMEWKEAKEEINEPASLRFNEWKRMEREIAIHLGDFKLKKVM